MAEPDWILERERRQMEQILELDMEELQVEEVDDAGSSSSDVDTFLRNTHGDGGISTSEDLTVDTSIVSLQAHTYLGAKVDGGRSKFAFLDGDKVLNLPMFYLQGVVLFPEASLPLRVIQPRLVEAIDKAVNHVEAPCMIGVVHAYRRANDGHHTIASVGTTAEIQEICQLDDGSSCVFSRGQQRFRLIRHWLDNDRVPWGEVRIIEEDTPQRTPRDAFGQLAASNSFRQCASSMSSVYVSCSKQLDHVDSEIDGGSLSPTSTSSDHSVTDKRVYLSGFQSSGLVSCGSLDESSNEDEDPIHEQSCCCHDSVKEIDGCGQPDKHTITRDEDDLCFRSFLGVRKKDTEQQRYLCGAYNTKMASQAPLSFWPRWAYEMYDSYSLARRAADLWRQVIVNPSMDDHVRKPNHLSFYIGSNLPISGSLRQELLEIDGVSYRLQREIQLLKAFNIIRCRSCLTSIARRSDMVMLSSANAIGSLSFKEMITVHNATGLGLRGEPSKIYSWFPGYAWTIALCAACESNIGWLFRADKKNLHPKSFWAIRTTQVSDDTQAGQV
ncbi:hypothetical protein SETIT_5G314400v2 [Setaria italica]|uniref:Uncharacterized protein n=1 Tax=Setaria italica TaxID=4555 RepID=K3XG81_SETIT|nr:uncharacterized protein LOC101759218 [Setaria italica]RCV27306.1 hypothetical protein SETIT_5G314400v2 [Setaria italica]